MRGVMADALIQAGLGKLEDRPPDEPERHDVQPEWGVGHKEFSQVRIYLLKEPKMSEIIGLEVWLKSRLRSMGLMNWWGTGEVAFAMYRRDVNSNRQWMELTCAHGLAAGKVLNLVRQINDWPENMAVGGITCPGIRG